MMSKYKIGNTLKLKEEYHESYRVKQCIINTIDKIGVDNTIYYILVTKSDNDTFVKDGDLGHLGSHEIGMFELEDFNFTKDLKDVLDE